MCHCIPWAPKKLSEELAGVYRSYFMKEKG